MSVMRRGRGRGAERAPISRILAALAILFHALIVHTHVHAAPINQEGLGPTARLESVDRSHGAHALAAFAAGCVLCQAQAHAGAAPHDAVSVATTRSAWAAPRIARGDAALFVRFSHDWLGRGPPGKRLLDP